MKFQLFEQLIANFNASKEYRITIIQNNTLPELPSEVWDIIRSKIELKEKKQMHAINMKFLYPKINKILTGCYADFEFNSDDLLPELESCCKYTVSCYLDKHINSYDDYPISARTKCLFYLFKDKTKLIHRVYKLFMNNELFSKLCPNTNFSEFGITMKDNKIVRC